MIEIKIKPLSVNECWQGRRFKTPEYKKYEKYVRVQLPKQKISAPPFAINIEFGFSNSLADIDNPLKPFLDILQKKYGINDRDIYELTVKKIIVKKNQEFIKFKIKNHKL